MKEKPPTPVPLRAAQRIHAKCEQFEAAWNGPTRPQIDAFLIAVLDPERSWLLAELLALEVELRQSAGEQPTEEEYWLVFAGQGDREIIAAAFRHWVDDEGEASDQRRADRTLPSSRAPRPSPLIEGYEILEVLGRGGMGVVYKARDLRLKRLVALKMILAGEHAGAEHRLRFRAEAEMVARLQHPNIVQIFDIGEQDGHPYIAFEFIEGQTLAEFAGREPQPPRVAAELLEATARAVEYAHQLGIVHRDLKPANILLASQALPSSLSTGNGSGTTSPSSSGVGRQVTGTGLIPKITDFGLAKDLGANLDHTTTGTILGTPNYMSPEQAEGRRSIGPASDIYSLGAILYVLVTGHPPFQGTTPIETLKMVVGNEPVPPSQLQPSLAKDLGTICLKCLHKDPARRYESAGALADDLRRFLNDEPILARPSGRIEKSRRWCRRNPTIAALLASVFLVLALGVVVSSYFGYTATQEAQRARERAYASDMRLVQRAWDDKLLVLFLDLLHGQRPERTDNVDVRGFEWHYWRRLAKANAIFGHHRGAVICVCYSRDGKRLASASNEVKVWDAETGQEKLTFKGHTLAVRSVCFSPDGNHIVSGSYDRTVKVWDAATGEEKFTLKGHTASVNCVCFSPDGTRIVSGSADKTVKVWDTETGEEKFTFQGHSADVTCVSFNRDGKRVVSGSWDKTAKVWDAATGQVKLILGHTTEVNSVCFSRDGKRIVCGSADGPDSVKVWDAETGQEMLAHKGHLTHHANSVCFSPDGKHIASGGSDATVRVWDARPAPKALAFEGHTSQVTHLACSPNGRWLASSGGNWDDPNQRYTAGELRLWDTRTGALLHDLGGHSSGVTCVGFSPDGRYLASGSGVWDEARKGYKGGEVRLWDPASGALLKHLEGHASGVLCVAFSPDSQFLASADFAGEVRVAEFARIRGGDGDARPNSGEFGYKFTLPGLSKAVTTLAFSPDGRFLAGAGFDGAIKIWNLSERSEVASLPADLVYRVAFSPDGKQLAVAGLGPDLLLYDTATYKEVRRLQGHFQSVTHVAFSPDGKRIATASEDKTVWLWESSSGQEILILKGHTHVVRCVEFSPDGQRLFSGGWDRTIRLWDATPRDP